MPDSISINEMLMKKYVLPSVLAAVVAAGVLFGGVTLAYRGDVGQQGPYFNEKRHAAMEQAFENNDYNVWKELMQEREQNRVRVMDIVNEDNFARFAHMYELQEEGRYEEARQIREELGFPVRERGHGPRGMHHGTGRN